MQRATRGAVGRWPDKLGTRARYRELSGHAGQQRPYIDWLLERCVAEGVVADDLITDAAVELLAGRLGTPLQIEQYLTRALEEGWRVGEKPVTAELVEALLSPQLDELEPARSHELTAKLMAAGLPL